MAVTYTNANGSAVPVVHVRGDQKHLDVVVSDSAYATGGTVIVPAKLGLVQIDALISGGTVLGKPTAAQLVAGVWSVLMFSAIGTEVTDTTNVATDLYSLRVVGR